jgi:hypothetical protein
VRCVPAIQVTKKYNIARPASMLHSPMKRICPSLIFVARSKTPRHIGGLRNGRKPSTTSISANAPNISSVKPGEAKTYFFAAGAAGAFDVPEAPRIALKKSLPGSTTITSDLLRKLDR